jgi:hypothetical protein
LFIILILRTGVQLLKSYNKKRRGQTDKIWHKSDGDDPVTLENCKSYDLKENLILLKKLKEYLGCILSDVQNE